MSEVYVRKHRAVLGVVVALVASLALLAGCTGAGELSSSDMAKIGSTIITKGQYEARLTELEKQYEGQIPTKEDASYPDFQKSVLQYMVDLEVVAQKAAAMDIAVTDEEVTAEVDSIKQMFNNDEAAFQEALDAQKMTLNALKASIREGLLTNKVYESVTKDVTVTEDQIQAYYEGHLAEFRVEETRSTRHILFAPANLNSDASTTATEADWNAALARAKDVRKQITNGADFGEMATQYSDDPSTKVLGGDLGKVQKGMMVAEFEEANFSLDKLVVSEPIKTAYGYHLIQVTDITPAGEQTLDAAREAISATLMDEERKKAYDAWLKQAKEELEVTVKSGWRPTTTTTAAETAVTSGATTTTQ